MMDRHKEWLAQADYDMKTAEVMLSGGRNFYAVFMCHLSIEKALKGLYSFKLKKVPPKIHNLARILYKTGCQLPEKLDRFLIRLNEAQVATRYPDELAKLVKQYPKNETLKILEQGKEVLQWIKTQF